MTALLEQAWEQITRLPDAEQDAIAARLLQDIALPPSEVEPVGAQTTEAETPPEHKPIWEVVMELGREVPPEEWAKLPRDGSINYRHYLYGVPKIETDENGMPCE